jgi:hypothetical protein
MHARFGRTALVSGRGLPLLGFQAVRSICLPLVGNLASRSALTGP